MIGLGTGLRQLLDTLDGAVDDAYRQAGIDFRARFFPYVRLLEAGDDLSVGELAAILGFTQPAVTQTLALMRARGLVETTACADRRERRYRLTAQARALLLQLRGIWAATERAAGRLNAALPAPLDVVVRQALAELAATSFLDMIKEELSRASVGDRPDDAADPGGGPARPVEGADRPR